VRQDVRKLKNKYKVVVTSYRIINLKNSNIEKHPEKEESTG
jgi:hypothetical protein